MDGTKFTSIDIARNKAFTSCGHFNATGKLGTAWNRSIENSNGGRFCLVEGGREVRWRGQVVGGIGVSGALPSEDDRIVMSTIEGWAGKSRL